MNLVINGNALNIPLPDNSVQMCVTSPPYYGLRDYGTASWEGGDPECEHNPQKPDGGERSDRTLPLGRGGVYRDVCGKCGAVRIDNQIGLEETPEQYVEKLVAVFREVRRVLKDDGVLWLNLGDSYAGSCQTGGTNSISGNGKSQPHAIHKRETPNLKPKDLIGIPWMVAFALRADGWWLRQDVIWHKPNPMPESVKDRCTKAHEYIFLLSKSARYYYDAEAIAEPANPDDSIRDRDSTKLNNTPGRSRMGGLKENGYTTRNKRSVWTVTTKPYKEAHFATYPPDLIEPCIKAGSKVGDIVLDPFAGSGTTGEVAQLLGRDSVLIELNPEYCQLAQKRVLATPVPLFNV